MIQQFEGPYIDVRLLRWARELQEHRLPGLDIVQFHQGRSQRLI